VDEGGIRVPLWISWPRVFEHKIIAEPADHIDILPTLLELCGIGLSDSLEIDGRSLGPLLFDRQNEWPERNLFMVRHGNRQFPGSVRNNRYRLVMKQEDDLQLYDLWQDPSQLVNLAPEMPHLTDKMVSEYKYWYQEVSASGFNTPSVHIGHPQFPIVDLPTVGAEVTGDLIYKNKHGYAYDWVVNWAGPEDKLHWQVKVVRDGSYNIYLKYATQDTGNKIMVSFGGKAIQKKVKVPFTPQPYPNFDTVDRGRPLEYDWKDVFWGKVKLKKGKYTLKIQAEPDPGLEIYGVTVELVE